MIRLADYVIQKIADAGVTHVFVVTGGGAMHINDALGLEPRITYVCNHHEQACAMAAEGFARVHNKLAAVNVTTGPGGLNTLNGVYGAWTDSIPMLVISGQVKRETLMTSYDLPGLRQLGDQEIDMVAQVKAITKYAVLIMDPLTIRYHLEKAIHLATTGRPGPVWIDVPIDLQGVKLDPETLQGYDPAEDGEPYDMALVREQAAQFLTRIQTAERPALMLGTGVRLAGAEEILEKVSRKLNFPVATAWTALDLIDSDDPLYGGRPGTIGDRAGNFTVQNSDVLMVLGCRLNIRQVSYNWKAFARCADMYQVDADVAELNKPTVKPKVGIHCDARLFLEELDRQIDASGYDGSRFDDWVKWCRARVEKYKVVQPRHREFNGLVNPYHFLDVLYRKLESTDVTVCANGSACVITNQVAHIKKGQRLFCNSGSASMGFDLPAAIGASFASGHGKRIICIAGDGSIQMNLQELQTIVHHKLPIKIFVLNNNGYLSCRITQTNFFKGNYVGEGPTSGVSFPDIVKLAVAYGIPAMRIDQADFDAQLDEVLNHPGPVLCEAMLDPDQPYEPKLSAKSLPDGRIVSPPLEDLSPFLDREELLTNLLVPAIEY